MVELWLFCKGIGIITLTAFFVAILYAIISVLIENIIEDCLKIKKYADIKNENKELQEKINRLEIELVDKKLAKEYNDSKRTKN